MAGGTPGETYLDRKRRTTYEAGAADNVANVGRSQLGLETTTAARNAGVPGALAAQTVADANTGTATAELSLLLTQARATVWAKRMPSGKTFAEEFADATAKGDMAKVVQMTKEATVATEYAEKDAQSKYDLMVAQGQGVRAGASLDNARATSLLNPPTPGTSTTGGGGFDTNKVRANAQKRLQTFVDKYPQDRPPVLEDFGDPADPKTNLAFMKGQKDYNSAQLKIRGLQATMDLADYMPQILQKGILLPSDAENPRALIATYGAFKGAIGRNPKNVDKALDETKVKVDAWRSGGGKQEDALVTKDRQLEAGLEGLPPREKAMELAWINGHGKGGFHRYTKGPMSGEEKRAAAAAVRGDWRLYDKLLAKAHQHQTNIQTNKKSNAATVKLRDFGYIPTTPRHQGAGGFPRE